MPLKLAQFCDDPPPPQKKKHKILIPPKNIHFSENPQKILKFRILNPKKWAEPTYVWKYQSTPPPGVSRLLCGFSSQCHGFVCCLWLWYSLTTFVCHSCEQRWLWRVCTFAWSSLSLRHSSKFSCGDSNGDWMPFCARREWSGESEHLHRLTLAFVTVQTLLCCPKLRFVSYSRQQRILWWVCTFAQAKSLDNVINIKISCAGSKCSWESAHLHRLAWVFFTVSKYNALVEIAIFVTFMWTANDVVSLHQQQQDFCVTISALYQCVKKCSQCVVIKFLQ